MKGILYVGGAFIGLFCKIGLREVEAEEIDGAYVAAIKQFGCRLEDILAVGAMRNNGRASQTGERRVRRLNKKCLARELVKDTEK